MPVGLVLMIVLALLRIARSAAPRDAVRRSRSSSRSACCCGWRSRCCSGSAGSISSSSSSCVVPLTVFAGIPIAFGFGMATFGYLALATRMSDLGAGGAARCRHVAFHPAVDPAVRVPRPADRDDRHGGRDGALPRQSARPYPRRAALRAGRRDVSRLRHLGLEGRRHGGDRAGAVSRDGEARRRPRRPRGAAGRDRRADRDRSRRA